MGNYSSEGDISSSIAESTSDASSSLDIFFGTFISTFFPTVAFKLNPKCLSVDEIESILTLT